MAAMTAPTNAAAGPLTGMERDSLHPLEVIPFFRRWKCGPVRDVLYTFIWNCLLGIAFWLIGAMFRSRGLDWDDLATTLIAANSIGYTLHAIFLVSSRFGIDRWARGFGQAATTAYYTVTSTLGVVIGFTIMALAFDP